MTRSVAAQTRVEWGRVAASVGAWSEAADLLIADADAALDVGYYLLRAGRTAEAATVLADEADGPATRLLRQACAVAGGVGSFDDLLVAAAPLRDNAAVLALMATMAAERHRWDVVAAWAPAALAARYDDGVMTALLASAAVGGQYVGAMEWFAVGLERRAEGAPDPGLRAISWLVDHGYREAAIGFASVVCAFASDLPGWRQAFSDLVPRHQRLNDNWVLLGFVAVGLTAYLITGMALGLPLAIGGFAWSRWGPMRGLSRDTAQLVRTARPRGLQLAGTAAAAVKGALLGFAAGVVPGIWVASRPGEAAGLAALAVPMLTGCLGAILGGRWQEREANRGLRILGATAVAAGCACLDPGRPAVVGQAARQQLDHLRLEVAAPVARLTSTEAWLQRCPATAVPWLWLAQPALLLRIPEPEWLEVSGEPNAASENAGFYL